ncbi:Uncharacterized conserved protein [Virgibacillus subterraneus]|uniref:Uncharacterized conserved protein n=1 Tax=Virgibacillus subterraneus TaxID=621109 RepID=A0A1H9FZX7_9BACI|nr:DUF2249 domain-containing protein [Virgibacillus subterraneus]SEQ43465.1 Uncharacterized conserved protein [Virgibacillus subterraneus]
MKADVKIVELDVREDLRMKKEPFDKIMGAVKEVNDGESFILHAPFNPVPLHAILRRKGFERIVEKIESKHWKVTYTKKVAVLK